MAAAVRIESCALSDPRIELLGQLAGYNRFEALGRLVHLWSVCTDRQSEVLSDVLVVACLGPAGVAAIVGSGLGEVVTAGIRVKGTAGRISWLTDLRARASAGGKARLAGAKRAGGKFAPADNQPAAGETTSDDQQATSVSPAVSSPLTLTLTTLKKEREREAPPTKRRPAGGLVSLPSEWEPTPEHGRLASELKLDIGREVAKFRDHAEATGRRQVRWGAAFALWLRRSSDYGVSSPGKGGGYGRAPQEPPVYVEEDGYVD